MLFRSLEKRKTVTPEAEEAGAPGVHTPSLARSKMVEQIQNGGIPTPSASPRLRSPMPTAKPAGKTKQSKLVFGDKHVEKEAAPAKATTTAKSTKGRKPLKTSRGQPKPKVNSLAGAFKATKNLAPAGKSKVKQVKEEDASVKENIGFRELPSLRPGKQERATFAFQRATTTPPPKMELFTRQTVSPGSKPRSMEHLID